MSLSRIGKRFGKFWAIEDVSLDIAAGEFVSIVGPSGSGKTTALSIIAGFERPSQGRIDVGGQDIGRLPPNRRNIGMVFQRYALFPHMSVHKNIEFPLRMRGVTSNKDARDRVEEIIDLVHLNGLSDRLPHELSGGQQQRVALARALVFDPPIVLMDEPLGALDKKLRETMQYEIKRMQERLGATVVYVTHDQEEALTMSDRVVVMKRGRIEQVGTPDNLYRCPRTAFVADFIGSINFIPATVGSIDDMTIRASIGDRTAALQAPRNDENKTLREGDACQVAVRPEHIELTPATKTDCALTGTLESVIFAGAQKVGVVRLALSDGIALRARLAPGQDAKFKRGMSVGAKVRADGVLIYPVDKVGSP